MTTEAEVGMMSFEDEGKSHESRNIGDFQELEKARQQMTFPLEPSKRNVALLTS